MLETTRRHVLDHDQGLDPSRWLVLIGSAHGAPSRCLRVDVGCEVLFGRAAVDEYGVVEVLDSFGDAEPDSTLSRRHARVSVDEGGAYIVDLGSTNGTWLNGRRLRAHVPARLVNGDMFGVGTSRFGWLESPSATPEVERGTTTGWLDREAFERACLTALVRAQRYERPLALMVVSGCGGAVEGSAQDTPAWYDCLRPDDVLGRLGAGEWAVLMPETGLGAAHIFGDVVRAVASHGRRRMQRDHEGLRLGVTALCHAAVGRDGVASEVGDGDLALDLDSVRLFIAAAREDRDRNESQARDRYDRALAGASGDRA